MNAWITKLGKAQWAVLLDYGDGRGASGLESTRQGWWCQDRDGGFGVGYTAAKAIDGCTRPVTYRTRRAAIDAAEVWAPEQDAVRELGLSAEVR